MEGDARRFGRADALDEQWRIFEQVLAAPHPVVPYRQGTWGPSEAEVLVAGGRRLARADLGARRPSPTPASREPALAVLAAQPAEHQGARGQHDDEDHDDQRRAAVIGVHVGDAQVQGGHRGPREQDRHPRDGAGGAEDLIEQPSGVGDGSGEADAAGDVRVELDEGIPATRRRAYDDDDVLAVQEVLRHLHVHGEAPRPRGIGVASTSASGRTTIWSSTPLRKRVPDTRTGSVGVSAVSLSWAAASAPAHGHVRDEVGVGVVGGDGADDDLLRPVEGVHRDPHGGSEAPVLTDGGLGQAPLREEVHLGIGAGGEPGRGHGDRLSGGGGRVRDGRGGVGRRRADGTRRAHRARPARPARQAPTASSADGTRDPGTPRARALPGACHHGEVIGVLAEIPYTTFPKIEIGPLELRTFGFVVAVGVLLGAWLAARHGERYGVTRDTTYSLAMRMVIVGVIGSRITWVLSHTEDIDSPIDVIAVWEGGLQFSGGFLFAVLAGYPVYRHWNRLTRWHSLDGYAYGLAIGLAIGRIACYSVGEHFGRQTSFLLGVRYDGGSVREADARRHPAARGDGLPPDRALRAHLPGRAVPRSSPGCCYLRKTKPPAGVAIGIFCLYYGVCRFISDSFRVNDERVLMMTGAQYLMLAPDRHGPLDPPAGPQAPGRRRGGRHDPGPARRADPEIEPAEPS